MIYLKNYDTIELLELFTPEIKNSDFLPYIEKAIEEMKKNNWRIDTRNLNIYSKDGLMECYSYSKDAEDAKNYYNINKINPLIELSRQVANNCSRLARGFEAY